MDPNGRPVLGEPHGAVKDLKKQGKEKGGEHHSVLESLHLPSLDSLTHMSDNLSDYSFPVKPVLGILGGLVGLWVVFSLMSRPAESVADRARYAVEALAHDDLSGLKSYASDTTRDDLVRWYDVAHMRLEEARKSWPTKESTIQIVVVEEDPKNNRGEVEAFIVPSMDASTQTASVFPPPVETKASNKKKSINTGPVSFHLNWVWSGSHWWIDGRQALATVAIPQ